MMTLMRFIAELYQEEPGGTFTHDGVEYDLNAVLRAVDGAPIKHYAVRDLEWVGDDGDWRRASRSDVGAPILVTRWRGRLVVLDGLHRLMHAEKSGVDTLPGRYVDASVLGRTLAHG